MIRRPPRSTLDRSSAASDVYKRQVDRVLALVDRSRREGAVVTTEAYPYGAGMTMIGAVFLAPERLAARGLQPTDIVYARTNERVRDAAHLSRLRAADPGGPC